jgi:hypothetical protein
MVAAQCRSTCKRGRAGWAALLFTACCSAAHGQTVVITGGADASGHTYTWQVANNGESPIVEVRFPHYRAGLFFVPPGWSQDCTALVHVGVKDEPGVCAARAGSPGEGIASGRSATFSMQVAPAGAKRGRGEATVRLADGTEMRVGGVEFPQAEGLGDKYVSLIGLGAVFIIFILAQAIRKRRKTAMPAGGGPGAGKESRSE